MKLSDIARLLEGSLSGPAFLDLSRSELGARMELLGVRGTVVPIPVIEDQDLIIDHKAIERLCNLFISGDLSGAQLSHIADTLQLSDRTSFVGAGTADFIAEFTDPQINGSFLVQRAKEIVSCVQHSA